MMKSTAKQDPRLVKAWKVREAAYKKVAELLRDVLRLEARSQKLQDRVDELGLAAEASVEASDRLMRRDAVLTRLKEAEAGELYSRRNETLSRMSLLATSATVCRNQRWVLRDRADIAWFKAVLKVCGPRAVIGWDNTPGAALDQWCIVNGVTYGKKAK